MSGTRALRAATVLASVAIAAASLTACGSDSTAGSSEQLRLGYFPNLTHATPIVGIEKGFLQESLGDTELSTQTFNAGTTAVEALAAGAIDAAYLGPNPAVNSFAASEGESLRIVAGATSGGAALVVQPEITSPEQLEGATLASPQLGNTQDVALRHWLDEHGYETSVTGGGDVEIQSAENATILTQFQQDALDGAWVPEPWASRLVDEAGGKVLVDEADLWPGGRFVTTHLVVNADYLAANPAQVRALVEGHVATNAWIHDHDDAAKTLVNEQLLELTGKSLSTTVLDRAWDQLTITDDPIATSLIASAAHGVAVGVSKDADLHGIYDLTLLNETLKADRQRKLDDAGYGPGTRQ